MNLAALSTLAAIMERGSFAAAAQQVGCTPSAVSLQVKRLEEYFGRPLFDRSTRSVRATPFALEVAEAARSLSGRIEALRARPANAIAGRLKLGAISSVQTDALPQALRALRARHPALQADVVLDDSDALLAALKAGRIDAAALVRPQGGGSSRLAWQELAKQRFVMLAPASAKESSPQSLLQCFDWIRYDPALTGGRIAARHVRRRFPAARCAMDLRSIDAIVAMVSAGLGVSIVPQPRHALLAAHGVRMVSLGRSAPARQIAFARRSTDIGNRNLDAVHEALAAAFAGNA